MIANRAQADAALPAGGILRGNSPQSSRAPCDRESEPIDCAINGPENVVISGAAAQVDAIAESLQRDGVGSKPLNVSHAFHSPLMAPMLDEFEAIAARTRYNPPRIPVVSNVTGSIAAGFGGSYWRSHVAGSVRFADGVAAVLEKGCAVLLEVGPAPVLLGMARQCADQGRFLSVPSLRPGRDTLEHMLESAAELYMNGVQLDWRGLEGGASRRKVGLPTYPFQRERFWFDMTDAPAAVMPAVDARAVVHPLLGSRLQSPALDQVIFQTEMSPARVPAVRDHVVQGMCVFPGTGYLEAMQSAVRLAVSGVSELAEVAIEEPLILDRAPRRGPTIWAGHSGSRAGSGVRPRWGRQSGWTSHASER